MLGDKVGEESGQIIGTRVLPADGAPSMEMTYRAQGRMLGVEMIDTGTYVATMRPNGTIYGEGQGVMMSPTGEGATWKGSGVGHVTEDGGTSFRGAIYYSTASEALDRLNHIACVYEYSADAEGNTRAVVWEWS